MAKKDANDLAVKAWEEKKRAADSAQGEDQSVDGSQLLSIFQSVEPKDIIPAVPSSISNDSASRSVSRNSETGEIPAEDPPLEPVAVEGADHQEERRPAFERNVSPLFVTPEPVLEFTPGSRGAPIEIQETQLPGSRPSDFTTNDRAGASHSDRSGPKHNIPYCNAPFEYLGGSSIPPEYRLPDETEEFAKSKDSVSPLSTDSDAEKSSGSLTLDQTKELKCIDLTREPEPKTERDRPDEIAETPPTAWAAIESQPSSEPDRGTVTLVSSSHSVTSEQRRWDNPNNSSRFEGCTQFSFSNTHTNLDQETISSHSTTSSTVYHSNSTSQSAERPSQAKISELPSTHSSQEGSRKSKSAMDKDNSRGATADFMEKYSSFPGSTQAEKMENARAQMREKIEQSRKMLRASARPSGSPAPAPSTEMAHSLGSAGDREHAPPQTKPVSESPSYQSEMPSPKYEEEPMQTIQPSALTVSHTEPPPGSVQLGLSEFAIPLPMDSRVKSDYEEILKHESRSIREFMSAFGLSSGLSEPEVSSNF